MEFGDIYEISIIEFMRAGSLLMNLQAQAQQRETSPRTYFTEPSLSPDRKEIAFVSGGDIWTVPASGGVASLLVSHTANEARPLYSPDGKQLAFVSNRTGSGDIYVLTCFGELRSLTFDDGLDLLEGWSRDGQWFYFSSTAKDIGGLNDIYRVNVDGGTPMAVVPIVIPTNFSRPFTRRRHARDFFTAETQSALRLSLFLRDIEADPVHLSEPFPTQRLTAET